MDTLKRSRARKSSNRKSKIVKPKAVKKKTAVKAVLSAKRIDWSRQLQPLQDRIVVVEVKESQVSASGLILPLPEDGKPIRGHVVAVGAGGKSKKGKLRPLDVKVGDLVLVAAYVGSPVTVEAQDAWIIREADVLGVIET